MSLFDDAIEVERVCARGRAGICPVCEAANKKANALCEGCGHTLPDNQDLIIDLRLPDALKQSAPIVRLNTSAGKRFESDDVVFEIETRDRKTHLISLPFPGRTCSTEADDFIGETGRILVAELDEIANDAERRIIADACFADALSDSPEVTSGSSAPDADSVDTIFAQHEDDTPAAKPRKPRWPIVLAVASILVAGGAYAYWVSSAPPTRVTVNLQTANIDDLRTIMLLVQNAREVAVLRSENEMTISQGETVLGDDRLIDLTREKIAEQTARIETMQTEFVNLVDQLAERSRISPQSFERAVDSLRNEGLSSNRMRFLGELQDVVDDMDNSGSLGIAPNSSSSLTLWNAWVNDFL